MPPPDISVIQNNICFDIVNAMNKCIHTATETNANVVSLQKNYTHSIYYPTADLKKCGEFISFEKNNKINIEIVDKINTQMNYTTIYDHTDKKIVLHL
jgi:hypothetical protein